MYGCTPTALSTGYHKCVVRALAVRGEGLVVKQVGPRRLGNLTLRGCLVGVLLWVLLGLYGDHGKKMETSIRGYIGSRV